MFDAMFMQRYIKSGCQILKKSMKIKMTMLILILVASVLSCRKQDTPDCLKAKVVRVTCASMVIEVLNNDSIGEDGWLDIYSNSRYDNVFTVSNTCHLTSEPKVGDVVYIKIAKSGYNDCIRCALYDAAPVSSYDVKSISNLPCEGGASK